MRIIQFGLENLLLMINARLLSLPLDACSRRRPCGAQGTEYPALKFRSNYLASYYLSHAPNTTPWWPSWSPDGSGSRSPMYGSIWRVDPKTGVAEELTYNAKVHSSPGWSPDGQWIVYTADDDWNSIQLEIVNVATGEIRKLTNDNQLYRRSRLFAGRRAARLCDHAARRRIST